MNAVTTQLTATDFQKNFASTFQFQISLVHRKKSFLGINENFG